MKRLTNFAPMNTPFRQLRTAVQALRLWVDLDPADNSCTLSEGLFDHMKRRFSETKVFAFAVPSRGTFAFTPDHGITKETQLCQIQYNEKFRCIGFETLNPSVGHILYDYGLPSDHAVRLSVSVWRTRREDGGRMLYYQINRPDAEHHRHDQKA